MNNSDTPQVHCTGFHVSSWRKNRIAIHNELRSSLRDLDRCILNIRNNILRKIEDIDTETEDLYAENTHIRTLIEQLESKSIQ